MQPFPQRVPPLLHNMIYIPSTAAKVLTERLWALSDPNPTRGTTALFNVIAALDDSKWLEVAKDLSILIHAEAELNGIADILQPWIDQGLLPANTNTDLAALIESKRGQRLTVYQAFPALFQLQTEANPTGLGKTYQQMVDAGLIIPLAIP